MQGLITGSSSLLQDTITTNEATVTINKRFQCILMGFRRLM
jgi:hypothetical protein